MKCRLLSFGHTLAHNRYIWHGGVEADHVVISGYNVALKKGTLVYKVGSELFKSKTQAFNFQSFMELMDWKNILPWKQH